MHRKGDVRLRGQIPLVVTRNNSKAIQYVNRVPASFPLDLNFGLPIRHKAALDRLIARQGRTHTQMSRAQIYAKFSPNAAQFTAVKKWLRNNGFKVTHLGRDRTLITARAKSAVVQRVLKTRINVYNRRGYTSRGLKIAPYTFFSNTRAPSVPARLGLQSITGLTNMDRFFTDQQLSAAANKLSAAKGANSANARPSSAKSPNLRSGGYFPRDIRAMYDEAGHGFDASGQTIGFTLWGAGETQKAMTDFATTSGDTPITVDAACNGDGTPFQPSSCTNLQVSPNHLVTILENGNDNGAGGNFEYAGNEETALDIEQAHGTAPGAAMKYYDADCSATPSPGLDNGDCNGSDVGLEDAMEDSSNDPTLHSVSDSWGIGGDAEYGLNDPFYLATENAMAMGAAAGTTHWDGTGDSGTEFAGYPADSQYAIGVGGTSVYSTNTLSAGTAGTTNLSTELTWSGGGSWCAPTEPRPSWQTGAAVTSRASCPNRVIPDVSAIADPNTGVFVQWTNGRTAGNPTDRSGSVGGTSVAGPELNGMEAVTENFIAAQSYPGATPTVGFEGPTIYQLGNGANANSYFRDVLCGNTADPTGGPDGDAALPGWDAATGFGAPDWFNYTVGYAKALGATGLAQPGSLSYNYKWTCAQTPGNAIQRGISMPTKSVGYSVGSASGSTPWPAMFMPSGAWGAVANYYKTTDGGSTWQTTNSDMMSIACPSATTCVEVGDGGRIRRTTDSGTTWTYMTSQFNKALTQVACPSASICYAAGARGVVIKSTDGGVTWSFTPSQDNNPIYGMSCPSTTVCFTTDLYAHVMKTTDGGGSWTMQTTPVTTPDINVPGSGGPEPFAGLFGITCTDISDCVAVGGFPPTPTTDPPIVTTTNGGLNWTLQTSNAGTGHYLSGVSCAGGTCYAVGRNGTIVKSTNPTASPATWATMTSNVSTMLNAIKCVSATTCIATGQTGTVDVLNGGVWTPTTALAGSVFLSGVACVNATHCYTAGKQGVTLAFDWTNVATSAVQQAGGGTTQQTNSISCVDASDCVAVGNAGTILTTTNAGQTWLPKTSGVTANLAGVSCNGTTCEAVGAVVSGAATILTSTNSGATWAPQVSGTASALTGIACTSASACVAVGAAGTILTTSNGGGTWTPATSGTTTGLTAVTCKVSGACEATGGVVSGSAVILGSSNGGSTWAAQVSHSTQALNAIACSNASACYAGGAAGTVVTTTNGGATWTQQGNPLSGPTTALNITAASGAAITAAVCTSAACEFGTGALGNILRTQLLTVTVNASGPFGTTPNLTNLSPSDPDISYDPASEEPSVTGTLTCSTTATSSSDAGSYPVTNCSGLSDSNGFSVQYDPASSYTVGKTGQTIDFPAIDDKTYGDNDFLAGATASSNLPVSYAADPPSNCTVDPNSGLVHIVGAGDCTITASQAGNNDYTAATDVDQSFTIAKADQTIDISSTDPKTFGDSTFEVDADATSGLPVSLSADPASTCTIDPDSSPTTVTITGSGTCTITGSQAGDSNYNAAPDAVDEFDVDKANQTISFDPIADTTFNDPDISLDATASSGLDVNYDTAGPCTIVAGPKVHATGAGSCTVTAHQPGDSNYNPAPDETQQFDIAKDDQTITFAAPADRQFGSGDFTVSATSTSGLTVTFGVSGDCTIHTNTIHLVQAGTCTVTASQVGDSDYHAAADVSHTFTITKGDQTITFAALSDKTLGDADFTVSGSASSGLTVAFSKGSGNCTVSGTTVHLTGAGTCTVDANQAGDSNWNAATQVIRQFTINKATPTVQVTASPANASYGTVTYSFSVLGTAGIDPTGQVTVSDGTNSCGPVTLTGSGTGSCSIFEDAGSYTITASYAGDSNFVAHSATLDERVLRHTTTVTFTSSTPAGTHHGSSVKVTFTSTVTGLAGHSPTGSVRVHDGKGNTCTGPLNASGSAHCAIVEKKGTRSITATYLGDTNNRASNTNKHVVVS